MKKTQLTPNKILIEFPTIKEMTLSMFRISEYFESDCESIRGRKFTMDELVDAYTDEKGEWKKYPGGETYFAFWDGYNVPKSQIDGFVVLYKDELSKREEEVLKIASELPENGYLITCEEGDEMTLKHENAHGIFFENEEYRNKATDIINSIPEGVKERFIADLKEMDYNDDVLIDEMHAYLVAFDEEEWEDCFSSVKEEEISEHRDKLQELYDENK